MKKDPKISSNPLDQNLIAPCGMNCALCLAYQREKNKCPGCRYITHDTSVSRSRCRIKNCEFIKNKNATFCHECENFPCERLKNLDKRYRTKYNMSMIDNLNSIKENGMDKFLISQEAKWKCKKCGGMICCHKNLCLTCNSEKIKT